MKNFALVIAFALLAVVSASAAEIPQAAPAMTSAQQTQEPSPLFAAIIRPPVPRCYTLDGTSCPAAGATTACTDACNNNLSCTCYNVYAPPYYVIVTGHYWHCNTEC